MDITVLFFGQLAELADTNETVFQSVIDTDALKIQLQQKYPPFADAAYIIAVNKIVTDQNIPLFNGATVALLPPFSGG
ncbi:MAG: MoaD/ThiS family protein [Ferruginibacter sp.]|nr:MoaD/ThiS family protein [Ferruginibacter sp.]